MGKKLDPERIVGAFCLAVAVLLAIGTALGAI